MRALTELSEEYGRMKSVNSLFLSHYRQPEIARIGSSNEFKKQEHDQPTKPKNVI